MAKTNSNTRRLRLREVSGLYKRMSGISLDLCAYCSSPRESIDHVPPVSYVERLDIDEFVKDGGEFLLVPACMYCNGVLGSKKLLTYLDRLLYLFEKYSVLASKVDWTDDELSELGHNLTLMIQNYEFKRRYNALKLLGVSKVILALPE